MLFGFAGISFAAQNSLPGDFMYPLKIRLNEKILAFMPFLDEPKPSYYLYLAHLRLEEAEQLAVQGKLNKKLSKKIVSLLNEHITDAKNSSKATENKSKANLLVETSSSLEASLSAHGKILSKLADNRGKTSEGVKNMVREIQNKTEETKQMRQDSEKKLSVGFASNMKADSEKKAAEAENNLIGAINFIDSKKGYLSEDFYILAKTNIHNANSLIIQGQTKLQLGEYKEAFILFQEAIRTIEEIKINVDAAIHLKVNVLPILNQ